MEKTNAMEYLDPVTMVKYLQRIIDHENTSADNYLFLKAIGNIILQADDDLMQQLKIESNYAENIMEYFYNTK